MCCIWYDNGKHREASIYSLRIRSSLISNEGFVLARNCLDKSFLPGINIFPPCFFLKQFYLPSVSFLFFFLILLRQQWPVLIILWMHTLIKRSTFTPMRWQKLVEKVNLRGFIWALGKEPVSVSSALRLHPTHCWQMESARGMLECGQTLKLKEASVQWKGQLQGSSLNFEQVGFCWHVQLLFFFFFFLTCFFHEVPQRLSCFWLSVIASEISLHGQTV